MVGCTMELRERERAARGETAEAYAALRETPAFTALAAAETELDEVLDEIAAATGAAPMGHCESCGYLLMDGEGIRDENGVVSCQATMLEEGGACPTGQCGVKQP